MARKSRKLSRKPSLALPTVAHKRASYETRSGASRRAASILYRGFNEAAVRFVEDADGNAVRQWPANMQSYTNEDIHPCWKDPFDLAPYSMLLWREKRKTIIEIGSAFGGSGLWFRDMQVAMEIRPCVVISIDQNPPHSEISGLGFLKGDAHDLASVLPQEWLANGLSRRLLVVVVGRRRPGCWPAMRSARCARRC